MSSDKSIFLITENREGSFSKKVIEAASVSKQNLIVESASFKALGKVINGEVGVVVLDHDELGSVADYFFRSIRIFHSTTPVLMAFSKKIIFEQLISRAHDRDISIEELAKVMVEAIDLDNEMKSEFNLSYVFEKDISLQRMAEIMVKSMEFDKELCLAKKDFEQKFEERGIGKLTGKDLTAAIDELRKEAYSSPVFSHLRAQMDQKAKEYKGDACNILH